MKYCPSCETRYDDEVMRFCTKDGTPLIEEGEPNFTALPSEDLPDQAVSAAEDDEGELTVVRRNVPVPPPPSLEDDFSEPEPQRQPERIVVPMERERPVDPIRNRNSAVYYQQPKQNTFKVVVLTVIGTLFVLGIGAVMFALLRNERAANTNINLNANLNANQNANYGIDTNFNFNVNSSSTLPTSNTNISFNTNAHTPTPTPSPTATPTPRPSVVPTATPDVDIEPATPRPSPTVDLSRPRTTPTQAAPPPTMTRTTPRPTPRATPDN